MAEPSTNAGGAQVLQAALPDPSRERSSGNLDGDDFGTRRRRRKMR
jgi:hypothetical protein